MRNSLHSILVTACTTSGSQAEIGYECRQVLLAYRRAAAILPDDTGSSSKVCCATFLWPLRELACVHEASSGQSRLDSAGKGGNYDSMPTITKALPSILSTCFCDAVLFSHR